MLIDESNGDIYVTSYLFVEETEIDIFATTDIENNDEITIIFNVMDVMLLTFRLETYNVKNITVIIIGSDGNVTAQQVLSSLYQTTMQSYDDI